MKMLMITWTDFFEGTGQFFQWIFKGVRVLGHIPNIMIWCGVGFLLVYWTLRLVKYRKEAAQNSTIE